MTDFLPLLREFIERSGISEAALAAQAGTNPPTLSLVLSGKRTPPAKDVEAWSSVFAKFPVFSTRDIAQFRRLGLRIKAFAQSDAVPYLLDLESRFSETARLLGVMAEMAEKHGMKLPHGFSDRVRAIVETLEPVDGHS